MNRLTSVYSVERTRCIRNGKRLARRLRLYRACKRFVTSDLGVFCLVCASFSVFYL